MTPSALSLTLLFLLLIGTVFALERRPMNTRLLSLAGVLSALIAATRIPMAVIPGLQLATALIICLGLAFGSRLGLTVGLLVPLLSNCVLGHGPWTLWQMLAWGLCGAVSGFRVTSIIGRSRAGLALYGVAWGFLFGWINNLWFWMTTIQNLNWETWLGTCILASFPIDLLHALGNAAVLTFCGPQILRTLRSYQARFAPPSSPPD